MFLWCFVTNCHDFFCLIVGAKWGFGISYFKKKSFYIPFYRFIVFGFSHVFLSLVWTKTAGGVSCFCLFSRYTITMGVDKHIRLFSFFGGNRYCIDAL